MAEKKTRPAPAEKNPLHTVAIGKKTYYMHEMSARKYQEMTQELVKDIGADWAVKGGVEIGIIMLTKSLKTKGGEFVTTEQLWDLPIKRIRELSEEVTRINGVILPGARPGAEPGKN